ncbi:Cytochrome c, class I precursor [hydrothermal vent metagenome]|uniref:Cytochrome c, class I n=1 Tax=hydrothermal vent metagenome TaxID=652676 RepID=A0A1W1BN41_9ZZZZ
MKKQLMIISTLALLLNGTAMADANLEKGAGAQKLAKMAGEKSPFYRTAKEAFPKDYFLVNQNLPFLVGVSLFHPNSDTLNLDKKQLEAIIELKNSTVPKAAKVAKEIKAMELELAKASLDDKKEPKSLNELVEKISKARTALTKGHLECIHKIQTILSDKQYATLLKLASTPAKPKVTPATNEGQTLFTQKCATCHITTRPKDMSTLIAPPLMGVMRHLKDTYSDKSKAVVFIKDYVLNPSKDKAVCMPQKIKRFGLMPSQKGNVTEKELEVIANWMFDNFPPKGFRGMGHGRFNGMQYK